MTAEDVGLDGSAKRDDLVGVEVGVGGLLEEFRNVAADQRHTGRATHEHHLIDVRRLESRIHQCPPARPPVRSTRAG